MDYYWGKETDSYKKVAIAVAYGSDTYFIEIKNGRAYIYKKDNVSFDDVIYDLSPENQYWLSGYRGTITTYSAGPTEPYISFGECSSESGIDCLRQYGGLSLPTIPIGE